MQTKSKFIVTHDFAQGELTANVGDEISLTETQAKNLFGFIKPAPAQPSSANNRPIPNAKDKTNAR